MNELRNVQYWREGCIQEHFPHSVQEVLTRDGTVSGKQAPTGSCMSACGTGTCNCGGGCNQECGGE